MTTKAQACPCGSGKDYATCCGRFIERGDVAQTAEELMRSRYSAYVVKDEAYLKATWHPSTRPTEALFEEDGGKWLGLEVKKHVPAGDRATVEFVA
ncbi:MAG TPA: YchJ family metal-binding protein, partial [Noviherbaspirillum sp.]|nr:YchJ family metal-binding protein [Noviherbaspirillum sp.]